MNDASTVQATFQQAEKRAEEQAEERHEAAPPERRRRDRGRTQTVLLASLLALAAMYTLYFARDVLLPVFLAFMLSQLLRPVVKRLRRWRIPEGLGAVLVVLVLLGGMGGVAQQLSQPASEWIQRAPKITRQLEFKLVGLRESFEQAREATRRIQAMASTDEPKTQQVVVRGPSLAEQMLTQTQLVLAHVLMMIFLLYFFLAFGRPTVESLIQAMPRIDDRLHFADVVNTVQVNIAAYLLTITLINAVMGVLVGVAMSLLGMPNPVLWGAVSALLNFIPYIGPAITSAILLVVALTSFESWGAILAPPAVFLVLHGIESNLVTPTVVGRRLTLNPIAVFFTVLFWGWLWGVAGAIIAVPILAVIKIVCDATPALRMVGALLGSPSEEIALPASGGPAPGRPAPGHPLADPLPGIGSRPLGT